MIEIITKIMFCMFAAAILGFVIGWLFSLLVKNEKHQKEILSVKDKYDKQSEQINLLKNEHELKDKEIERLKKRYNTLQMEMLSNENKNTNEELETKISKLESENLILLEQIKEQKICEDENKTLKAELKELEDEKERLLDKIDELKEFESSYKKNIHKIAELESQQKKFTTTNSENSKKSVDQDINIDKKICDNKEIISDDDANSLGVSEDKLSKIIKNLFSSKSDKKD